MHDLVKKAQSGDLEAFGLLVDCYKDMTYGAAYAILGNFHDAQDTAQEALLRAWRKLATLEDCGAFPGWLYRITRNLALDRVRRTRGGRQSIDDVVDTLPDAPSKGPGLSAERRELHEAVLEAVGSLSEPNRVATTLFYINGYSIEEVAGFLEVPSGTVKRRLHDSRTQLRERMVGMVKDTFKRHALPTDFSRDTLRKIGDFTCLEIIGAGPMGSVYVCEHPVLKRKVAIKIAVDGRPELQEWFRTERTILEGLRHPGFVKVLSHGQHKGRPYVVMELLQGMNLKGWLSTHKTDALWETLRLMVRLTHAVGHAHDREIVIGCIRPESVVALHNDAPVLVEAGFIEPALREAFRETPMPSTQCPAPECLEGKALGKQADIWHLGALMYELLAGEPLFGDGSEAAMREAVKGATPLDLDSLGERVPGYVMSVLERCLRKAPEERFASAGELRRALEDAQFADLVRLGEYDIQRLLMDSDPVTLAAALEGAAEETVAHILSHAGGAIAERAPQDMAGTPASPETAHAARCALLATADRLLEEQRIGF